MPAKKLAKELETEKEVDVKPPKEIEKGPQQKLASKDHNLKTENQYLKYIKISFPIVAVIFLAYFYRIWTRSHETKRRQKETSKSRTRSAKN